MRWSVRRKDPPQPQGHARLQRPAQQLHDLYCEEFMLFAMLSRFLHWGQGLPT